MQSSFKYFINKHKEYLYFYIWVLLTTINAIYLIVSLVLGVINKDPLYGGCGILVAFSAFGIYTMILTYLEEKS